MFDGLWTFEMLPGSNLLSINAGVVVLQAGRAYGGNSEYYIAGTYTYSPADSAVEIILKVCQFAGDPAPAQRSRGDFTLVLTGTFQPHEFVMKGVVPEAPDIEMGLRMTNRLAPEARE